MTRDEKIAEARRLHAAGWRYGQIGDELGVTYSCIYKWLNPEKSQEYNRTQNSRPTVRKAKRAWDRANRKQCECGATMARVASRCLACDFKARDEARLVRWALITKLWDQGLPVAEIAPQVGRANANALGVEMDRMKHAGWHLAPRRPGWTGHTHACGPPTKPVLTKQDARRKLTHAVWSGKVTRPDTCERCGRKGHVDGHHTDYSKPLEVEWLCRSCHMSHHSNQEVAA